MTVDFADYFWGDKHMGFSVLYQNMKAGQAAVKELAEFLKERAVLEEEYGKHMLKNLNKVSTYAQPEHGTFSSAWVLTKNALDRVHQTQADLAHSLQELGREVNKYSDDLHKTHRQIKQKEHPTFEAVNLMQTTTTCLQKAKETCTTRYVELEKLKRDNGAPKDITKAETKAGKAKEEYKQYVDKYGKIRDDFQEKLENSAHCFQEEEKRHLERLKGLLTKYAKHSEDSHFLANQVCAELRHAMETLNVDELLENFAKQKSTGEERPCVVTFEEPDVTSLLPPLPENAANQHPPPTLRPSNQQHSPPDKPLASNDTTAVANQNQAPPSCAGPGYTLTPLSQQAPGGSGAESLVSWGSSNTEEGANPPQQGQQATHMTGSTSQKKLAMWLPGLRNKKSGSQSGTTTPMDGSAPSISCSSIGQPPGTETNQSGGSSIGSDISKTKSVASGGGSEKVSRFLKKRKKKKGKPVTTPGGTLTSPVGPDAQTINNNNNDETRSSASDERAPEDVQVDAEGYNVRPNDVYAKLSKSSVDKGSSFSESDSEDEQTRRIHVEIKPKLCQPMNGSVDELRDIVGQMTLNRRSTPVNDPPEGFLAPMTTPQRGSWSGTIPKSKTFDYSSSMSAALIGGASRSKAGTDSGEGDPWAPSGVSAQGQPVKLLRPALTGDGRLNNTFAGEQFYTESGFPRAPLAPSLTGSSTRPRPRATTPTFMFHLGNNNSRRGSETGDFSRSDSMNSLDCSLNLGPQSPTGSGTLLSGSQLTAADIIPVAMALTETVHAWFQGTDTSRMRIRVFGSVQVSIPASAVPILCSADVDYPPLVFQLIKAERVHAVIPNKQVLSADAVSRFESCSWHRFSFDRGGLAAQLRKVCEQKPGQPFYNFEV